jgi:hypothetical protein
VKKKFVSFLGWIYYPSGACLSTVFETSNKIVFQRKSTNGVRVMVFNITFKNISVILWQSVSLVEETRVPKENH